ncbi:MAG: hypothetical protein AMXMBFR84_34980 [Candidatus Hydrogenedentota bacterium]
MRVGFVVLFRLLYRTVFKSRGTHARFTVRRFFVMAFFIPAFVTLQILHRIAFKLDDLFFGAYKNVAIKEPVFIVGIPRSGTTFLHRVMSKDTETFTTLKLWELIFAPSIVERKVVFGLRWLDGMVGHPGYKILAALENRIFAEVRKIHRVSLFEPEEDDLILFPIFASIFLLFPFPFEEELWHHATFDRDTPEADRRAIMSFYRECVRRHLYVHGPEKRFLSKNPAFSPKTDSLLEFFPDARVICNVRNPYSSVPSLMSFLSFSWNRFDNDPKGDRFREMIMRLAGHWYRMPMERLPKWPKGQYAFAKYDGLTATPRKLISELYENLNIPLTEPFRMVLATEEEKAKGYVSKHNYSLDKYGLTADMIREAYKDVFEYYGFETEIEEVQQVYRAV